MSCLCWVARCFHGMRHSVTVEGWCVSCLCRVEPLLELQDATWADVCEVRSNTLSLSVQGVFEDDDAIHLVMELCEGGGILDRMKSGNLTEARIAAIIRSVLRFIAQCHAKGIIYRCAVPSSSVTPDVRPLFSLWVLRRLSRC